MKPKLLVARPIFQSVIDALSAQFDVTHNQSDTPWTPDTWKQAIAQHDAALTTGSDPINSNVLGTHPRLKIAANMAVGFNNFDVPAMTSLGVTATNTPDVLTETTADFGFALLMATARRMTESEHFLRAGQWKQWRYDMFAGAEVHGSTLGILGMGRIGQGIARRGAHGFGMNVIYHNRSQLDAATEAECKAHFVDKDTLLKTADHLVLVLPYSAASHHAIGAAEIAKMKPTATLINIARGGIVDLSLIHIS
jgi:gluconate 2-dehydrogenase